MSDPTPGAPQKAGGGARDAVIRFVRPLRSNRRVLTKDAVAGLPGAIGSVPDGMAAAVLAGVNPIFGLYASFIGPIVGGVITGTELAVIAPTSAAALAAGSTLAHIPAADRPDALFLMTLLAGVLMAVAGVLRFGRYTRFVSNSVMVGFITGVATNILFGQLPDLTGVQASGSRAIGKAVHVLTHPGQIDLATTLIGLLAFALIAAGSRTRFRTAAALLALVVPSVLVAVLGLDSVATVAGHGAIPRGVPVPTLPPLRAFNLNLLAGAAAIVMIVLVQGAGVSESTPNPDGSTPDANRDFLAQGFANVASGLFKGQPVGASVGQTALNLSAGAKTRWASIFSGLWMLVILLAFSGLVGKVALTTLAAILMFAAIGAIKPRSIELTARTGNISRIALVTTFVAVLLLPIAAAVGIGVVLSLILQLNREALDLNVVRLVPQPDDNVTVEPVPAVLESGTVVALDVFGSLLFAGSRTLETRLPDPAGAHGSAVILRLRGRTHLASTALQVLARYAQRLDRGGNRLFLSGVEPALAERLRASHGLEALGPVELVRATHVLGESTREAYREALAFVRDTKA
jgi:SulP family sulfate permease